MIRRTRALFDIVREISLDEIREEATRSFSLVVAGPSERERVAVLEMLADGASPADSPLLEHDTAKGWTPDFERASLVCWALDSGRVQPGEVSLLRRVASIGLPVLVVSRDSPALVGDGHSLDDLDRLLADKQSHVRMVKLPAQDGGPQMARAILPELEAFDLALARRLPVFRPHVSNQLIYETSRANAEFALMSNLPALVPVVGNIVAATADLLVLTKNQMLLVFKLAAAYGRPIESGPRILTELIPVVGASFFWRSLARELAALLPAGVGVIPKTTIAYAGTYAAGRSAQYYYSTGLRPNRELIASFYKDALERVRGLLPGRGGERG